MNHSTERKVGAILSYIIIGLNLIVGVLYTPILTSKLGQSEYGLYQYINSIINYLTILDLGLGNAIIVYIARAIKNGDKEKINKLFSMFLSIFIFIGIITGIIGIVLYLNVNSLFNAATIQEINTAKILIIILIINIVISFPGSVFSNTINAHENFILLKVLNIFGIITKPIVMIPLLFLGFKSIALVTVTTIINFIIIFVNYLFCKFKLKIKFDFVKWEKKLLKEIFSFSIWIALVEIIDKVNWSVDNFLIGRIMGTISVSVYAIAAQLNQIYVSSSTAISGVLLPKITKLNESKDNMKEMNDIWINSGHIQLYIVGLVLSGFIIFGEQFIILWVGREYEKSYIIGIVLMAPMFVSLIQNVAGNIVRAKNKQRFMTIVYAFMAILNILISIPFIKMFGEVGAALGTAISLIIGNIIIKNIYYHQVIKLEVIRFFKNMFPLFIIQIIIGIIGFIIVKNIAITNWIQLFSCIFIYIIIYSISTLQLANNYEKELFKKIIKKLKHGKKQ